MRLSNVLIISYLILSILTFLTVNGSSTYLGLKGISIIESLSIVGLIYVTSTMCFILIAAIVFPIHILQQNKKKEINKENDSAR